jgi:hypothetical protein
MEKIEKTGKAIKITHLDKQLREPKENLEGIEDTLVLIHHELKHNITVVKNYGDVPPISSFPMTGLAFPKKAWIGYSIQVTQPKESVSGQNWVCPSHTISFRLIREKSELSVS